MEGGMKHYWCLANWKRRNGHQRRCWPRDVLDYVTPLPRRRRSRPRPWPRPRRWGMMLKDGPDNSKTGAGLLQSGPCIIYIYLNLILGLTVLLLDHSLCSDFHLIYSIVLNATRLPFYGWVDNRWRHGSILSSLTQHFRGRLIYNFFFDFCG